MRSPTQERCVWLGCSTTTYRLTTSVQCGPGASAGAFRLLGRHAYFLLAHEGSVFHALSLSQLQQRTESKHLQIMKETKPSKEREDFSLSNGSGPKGNSILGHYLTLN